MKKYLVLFILLLYPSPSFAVVWDLVYAPATPAPGDFVLTEDVGSAGETKYATIQQIIDLKIAATVNIADAGGIFTATNVEDALQENRVAINLNTAKVTNTDTQDLSLSGDTVSLVAGGSVNISLSTSVVANSAKTGITLQQASAITTNTAKISFDSTTSTRLANTSGTNTGDQNLSSYLTSESDPVYSAWDKSYLDLINTPTTITAGQASAITTNTAKIGVTVEEQNVNADWNSSTGDSQILNKPIIPTDNIQLLNGAGYITSAPGEVNEVMDAVPTNGNTTHTASSDGIFDQLALKANTSTIPSALSDLTDDTTHRVVTDTEKSTWNAKLGTNPNIGDATGTTLTLTGLITAESLSLAPPASGTTGEMYVPENPDNGTNIVGFKAPDALAADLLWTLPSVDGTAGQVLQTSGANVLSWVADNSGTDDQTAAEVSVDATGFTTNLSTSDDTVQKALTTLDGMTVAATLPSEELSFVYYDVTATDTGYRVKLPVNASFVWTNAYSWCDSAESSLVYTVYTATSLGGTFSSVGTVAHNSGAITDTVDISTFTDPLAGDWIRVDITTAGVSTGTCSLILELTH